ncbi:hypothetical protein BH23BAC1_BH23BAC1_21550 [soil metagenome]
MKNKVYFLAGTLFFLLGIYKISFNDYIESVMYISLAVGFTITGILKNELFLDHKKFLETLSWAMIILALFTFLFLLRTDTN